MQLIKKYMLLLVSFVYMHANAQEPVVLSHYVFDKFSQGRVKFKNGNVSEAKLNYNILSGEIIFESAPAQYMALANPEQVDTVFILDRKFIPVNHKFYEVLIAAPNPLFLEYTCTVKEPGSDIGYGMSSVTTGSTAIKTLIQNGGAYSLKLPDGFQVVPGYNYWILKDGKYQKAKIKKPMQMN